MRDGFRIYDTHVHLGCARHSGRRYSADELLRDMDRHGVDRSLVIPFPVVEDHRAAHEEIGRAVRAHPDRLSGAASLPVFLAPDVFGEELRRAVETWGLRALKLQPQYQPLNPVSRRSDFYFAAAAGLSLPVIVHTGNGAPFALPSLYILPARRFPELRLVLAHAGGGLYAPEAVVAATVCPNVWVELSALPPHVMGEVLRNVPPGRLMAGSDMPESVAAEIGKVTGFAMDAAAKSDILWRTPRRLFDGVDEA